MDAPVVRDHRNGARILAGQVLETIAQNSARMNPDLAGADRRLQAADFQTYVCGQIPALFICGNVNVDVQSFPSFSNVAINSQINAANDFISNNMQYNSWRPRRYRRGAIVLSMAAVRHRARLQHREFERQQTAVDRDGCIPQRALLRWRDENHVDVSALASHAGFCRSNARRLQRHRGDRICRDRADHAGDVLWNGRNFFGCLGRSQD